MIFYKTQSGQSLVEFLAAAGLLVSFLVAIPMVSKLGYLKLKANSAADYATWRANKGINVNNSNEMSREIGQRFFARSGADVLSDRNAECDDIDETDHYGNSLVNWRTVESKRSGIKETKDVVKTSADKIFGMFKHDSQHRITVNVPVNNETPFEDIPSYLNISASSVVLSDDWRAADHNDTKRIIANSNALKLYEDAQRPLINGIVNPVLRLFNDKPIKTHKVYSTAIVPRDRDQVVR